MVQVLADSPERVVDLGCGPGQLTATLSDRWPQAQVLGIDSSPEMIARGPGVRPLPPAASPCRTCGRGARPQPVDVIVSNATLQWVPDHRRLLRRSAGRARARRLARLPGARQLRRAEPPAAARAGRRPAVRRLHGGRGAAGRVRRRHLSRRPDRAGLRGQRLGDDLPARARPGRTRCSAGSPGPGRDRCYRRCRTTGGRSSSREYKSRLAEAYPEQPYGTLLPFRRVFVVARRPTAG